jgi:predicted PolB exonuclease-like 3'-5' exonuclease
LNPVLVFDIETVPDVESLRRLRDMASGLSDAEVAEFAFKERFEKTGSEFLPLHIHQVVAISCVLRAGDGFRVWSLGELEDSESSLIKRFFEGIEKYTPQLVSWNGGGFDLPVLHYRSLVHGIVAARYWDTGEDDRDFKWNNYISRYHSRHLDLMDVLARYQPRANAPLDEVAQMLGFPGKVGMSGGKVWEKYQEGNLSDIRDYCETDVVNTYLVYLRYQLIRGAINADRYDQEVKTARDHIEGLTGEHWQQFLAAWN